LLLVLGLIELIGRPEVPPETAPSEIPGPP
jgi:hypothetical protein